MSRYRTTAANDGVEQKRLMAESAGLPSDAYLPKQVDVTTPGDYGHDPLSEGRFRMVPSGDIVDTAEKDRRYDARAKAKLATILGPAWIVR